MKLDQSRWFYSGITLAISATAFIGFYFTYFAPIATGNYPTVSPAIHVHGWSFFIWYLLLPLQAILIAKGCTRLHMILGGSSVVLQLVGTTMLILMPVCVALALWKVPEPENYSRTNVPVLSFFRASGFVAGSFVQLELDLEERE